MVPATMNKASRKRSGVASARWAGRASFNKSIHRYNLMLNAWSSHGWAPRAYLHMKKA